MTTLPPPRKVSKKSSGQNDIKLRYTNCTKYGDAYETNKEIFKKKLSISRYSNNEDLFKEKCLEVGNNCWIKDHPDVLIEPNRPHLQCRKKAITDTVLLNGENAHDTNADDMISYFCPKNFTEKYERSLYETFAEQCNDKFELVRKRYLAFKSSIYQNEIPSSVFKYVPSYNGSHHSIIIIDINDTNIQRVKSELLDINIVMRTIAYNVVKELKMIDACNAMFEALEWIAQNIQNFNDDFVIFASGNDDTTYLDGIKAQIPQMRQTIHEFQQPLNIWGENDNDHIDNKNEFLQKFDDYLNKRPFNKNSNNIKIFSNIGIVNSELIIFCVCGIVVNHHSVTSMDHSMAANPVMLYWIKTLTEDSLKRNTSPITYFNAVKMMLIYAIGHELGHNYQGLTAMGLTEFFPLRNYYDNPHDYNGVYDDWKTIRDNHLKDKEQPYRTEDMTPEILAETFGLLCVEYYLKENFTDIQEQLTVFQFFFLALCASPADDYHLSYSTRIKLLKSNTYLYDLYKKLDKPYFRGGEAKLKKSRRKNYNRFYSF